jgi:predicted NBD/HSP70 family sugar kinase
VRNANLSAVLTLLFRGGPQSRAALARATGRNRSTIASLVGDLVAMGLASEDEAAPDGQVGRPSPVVSVSGEVAAIAVNPEIDELRVALVGLDGSVLRLLRRRYDTIPTAGEVLDATTVAVAALRGEGPACVGIGCAVPGQVRSADGVVRNAPHLRWIDEPFGQPLAEATGLPVRVANDASLGAIAEQCFGAGRGASNVLYLNGGASGIGGGAVVAGRPLAGAHGYAGEFGHIRVSSAEAGDSAGIAGTLEAMVTRAELLAVLGLAPADADRLHEALLADRTPAVRAVVERQLGHLATGLAAAVNVLNPQVVALGGFLASLLAYDPDGLRQAVAGSSLRPSDEDVEITASELGWRLLLIGAAMTAFEPLLANPAPVGRDG